MPTVKYLQLVAGRRQADLMTDENLDTNILRGSAQTKHYKAPPAFKEGGSYENWKLDIEIWEGSKTCFF